jgi:hypothetical protein
MPWSIYGFGTEYFGQRELQRDGSYVTTEFLTALGIPLVPLGSQRVRKDGLESFGPSVIGWTSQQGYEVRAAPMNWREALNVYLGAMGLLITILLALASPILLVAATDTDPVVRLTGITLLVVAAVAIAAAVYLVRRRNARLRAEWAKMGSRPVRR